MISDKAIIIYYLQMDAKMVGFIFNIFYIKSISHDGSVCMVYENHLHDWGFWNDGVHVNPYSHEFSVAIFVAILLSCSFLMPKMPCYTDLIHLSWKSSRFFNGIPGTQKLQLSMAVSINGGTPLVRWMVYFMEHPMKKMGPFFGGSPI